MQKKSGSSESISARFLGKYLSNICGVEIEPSEIDALVSKEEGSFAEQRQKSLEMGNQGDRR